MNITSCNTCNAIIINNDNNKLFKCSVCQSINVVSRSNANDVVIIYPYGHDKTIFVDGVRTPMKVEHD